MLKSKNTRSVIVVSSGVVALVVANEGGDGRERAVERRRMERRVVWASRHGLRLGLEFCW